MVALLPALQAPVEPIDALRRIAFLLERSRAGSYRVEAFRKAATTLKDGEELYAALRGDCHLHSNWSDGGSPIEEMVLTAIELDHDWMVLTDHSPQLRVANGLSPERLTKQLSLVHAIDASLGDAFTFFAGIEVDILDDGSLDQTPELLDRLDLVTASVHSKLRMNAAPMTKRMVAAASNPRVNVLGHCTGRLVQGSRGTRPQSEFDARAVFARASSSAARPRP